MDNQKVDKRNVLRIYESSVRIALMVTIMFLLNGLQMALSIEDRAYFELRYQEKSAANTNVNIIVSRYMKVVSTLHSHNELLQRQNDILTAFERMGKKSQANFLLEVP